MIDESANKDCGSVEGFCRKAWRIADRASIIEASYVFFYTMEMDVDNRGCTLPDTGLSELIVPLTRTEVFNKSLEIQQSASSHLTG